MEFSHTSVLLNETIENLKIKPDGIYVDGTLGGAGHSSHICERLSGLRQPCFFRTRLWLPAETGKKGADLQADQRGHGLCCL